MLVLYFLDLNTYNKYWRKNFIIIYKLSESDNLSFQDTMTYEKWNKNCKFENLVNPFGSEYFFVDGSI